MCVGVEHLFCWCWKGLPPFLFLTILSAIFYEWIFYALATTWLTKATDSTICFVFLLENSLYRGHSIIMPPVFYGHIVFTHLNWPKKNKFLILNWQLPFEESLKLFGGSFCHLVPFICWRFFTFSLFGWFKRSLDQSIGSLCNPHFAVIWPDQRSHIFWNGSDHWGMVTYNFFWNFFFRSIIRAWTRGFANVYTAV